jgi:hypothetical protein
MPTEKIEFLNEREAADWLRLKPRTLRQLRWRGGGPLFVRLSPRCIRYRTSDIRAWAAARSVANTAQPIAAN